MATVCNCKWCHCWPNDPDNPPSRSDESIAIMEAELLWWGPTPFGISLGYEATATRPIRDDE